MFLEYNAQDEGMKQKLSSIISKREFFQAQKIGDNLFKSGKYKEAVYVYQKIIEGGYTVDFDI